MATIQHRYLPYLPLLAQQEELQSIFDELRDIGGYNPLTNEFTPLNLKDLDDKVSDGTIGMIDSESLFTTIGAASAVRQLGIIRLLLRGAGLLRRLIQTARPLLASLNCHHCPKCGGGRVRNGTSTRRALSS